jgi:hypothetical protein
MRTHSHELVRQVLEAIDTADCTGELDVDIAEDVLQDHLDLLYVAGLAVAIDDPPFCRLTDSGLEYLLLSRDSGIFRHATERNPLQDNSGVLQSTLCKMRRLAHARQPAGQ